MLVITLQTGRAIIFSRRVLWWYDNIALESEIYIPTAELLKV